jgi:hypothetical protein
MLLVGEDFSLYVKNREKDEKSQKLTWIIKLGNKNPNGMMKHIEIIIETGSWLLIIFCFFAIEVYHYRAFKVHIIFQH